MLRSLLRKAGLFLFVGMARRLSDDPEAEPEVAETLGGRVPIPATTGASFVADVLSAPLEVGAGVAEVTSVGLTTGVGVAGELLSCWKG